MSTDRYESPSKRFEWANDERTQARQWVGSQNENNRSLEAAIHPTHAEMAAAWAEVYDPQDPIPTGPADLDEANHSTEAGAGFIVALIMAIITICAGLWLAAPAG